MAEERRFPLALSYQNIKDHKITIMCTFGLLVTSCLYVIYPTLTLTIANQVTNDLGMLMNSFQNETVDPAQLPTRFSALHSGGFGVKYNFTADIVPQQCLEENVLSLGENAFLSVCSINNSNNLSEIIIDIRKFTGNLKNGIKPTKIGINLKLNQWSVIKERATIIDGIAFDLSAKDDV